MSPLKSALLTTAFALSSMLKANGQDASAIQHDLQKNTTEIAASPDTLVVGDLTIIKLHGEKREIKKGLICRGYFDQNKLLVDSADFAHIKATPATQKKLAAGMRKAALDKENKSRIGEFNYYEVGTVAVLNGFHFQNKGVTTVAELGSWFHESQKTLGTSMQNDNMYAYPFTHYLEDKAAALTANSQTNEAAQSQTPQTSILKPE